MAAQKIEPSGRVAVGSGVIENPTLANFAARPYAARPSSSFWPAASESSLRIRFRQHAPKATEAHHASSSN